MELLRFVYKNFCENKRLLIFIIMGNFLTFSVFERFLL